MAKDNTQRVVRYAEETAWGTLSNPVLKPLFYVPDGFALDMNPTFMDSQSHRGRVGLEGQYLVGEDVGVTLRQELRLGESNPFIRGAMRASGVQYLSTAALPDTIKSTALSGTTFTVTLEDGGTGTTGNTNWVSAMGAVAGNWVAIRNAGETCGCLGVWHIDSISTVTETNDTLTLSGVDVSWIAATSSAANVSIGICHYEMDYAQPSFLFETEDVDASKYQHGTGLVVDSMTIEQNERGVVMATFNMMGEGYGNEACALWTGSRSSTYSTELPLHANGSALHVEVSGAQLTEVEVRFSVTIGNNSKAQLGPGKAPLGISQGKQSITGYVDYIALDNSLESYGLSQTDRTIRIFYGGAGSSTTTNAFVFEADRIQFGKTEPLNKMDPNGYAMVRLPFTAMMPASGTTLATIDMPGSDTK